MLHGAWTTAAACVLEFELQASPLRMQPSQQARHMHYMDPAESNLCSGNMHTRNMRPEETEIYLHNVSTK